MTEPSSRPHHHGDLRRALVAAGVALLAEGGLPALSLRGCAARAGVSHAAPAHHFGGLSGLLGAIAAEGFRRFTAAMTDAAAAAGPDAAARLVGISRGYLHFARSEPALFALMFGPDAAPQGSADLAEAGAAAYRVLAEACAPFVPAGAAPRATELAVWALVHGFAQLSLHGHLGPQAAAVPDVAELMAAFPARAVAALAAPADPG